MGAIDKILRIGVEDSDSQELKDKKILLMYLAILMSCGGVIWGSASLYFGLFFASTGPLGYVVFSILNAIVFYFTKNLVSASRFQVAISLFLPFIFQYLLGGILASGAVMLWGTLSFIAALTFQKVRTAMSWLVLYLLLVVIAGYTENLAVTMKPEIMPDFTVAFFAINFAIIPTVSFLIVIYFRMKNEQSEKILLENSLQLAQVNKVNIEANLKLKEANRRMKTAAELQKNNNKELEIAKNKAEIATNIKSDFLSVMSHEIRTPLNAVVGTIHLLIDENPRADQKKYLNTLKFSAKNLITLMNDILDYNKLESGNLELELTSINVKEIAQGIKEVYHNEAISKGIQFDISIDKNISNFLLGDPGRLIQVLNNLIGNAIKFTTTGSVTFNIDLVNQDSFSVLLKFQIIDTGIGISKDKQKIIFDSFTQAESDTTRHFGGTGLGLSIVEKIIRLFETEIYLESEEGNGSKFYFELELPINYSDQPNQKIKQEEDIIKINSLKGKKILIVDDNSVNLMMVKGFLKKWGIDSVTALSGKKALININSESFDLVLLDLRMPEMDGYQVAREIRNMDMNYSVENLPIIALSANALSEVEKDLHAAGMNDYVSKPFDPDKLMNIIHKYLS